MFTRKKAIIAGIVVVLTAGGVYLSVTGNGGKEKPTESDHQAGIFNVKADLLSAEAKPEVKGESAPDVQALMARVTASLANKSGAELESARVAAWSEMKAVLESPLPLDRRRALLPSFNALCTELFFSQARNQFSQEYTIKSGDSMEVIARRAGVTQQLVCQWNNIPFERRAMIRAGSTLKINKDAPRVVVDKSEYTLSYYFGDHLARQYIVAHGKGGNTPIGATTVDSKDIDPELAPYASSEQLEMRARWIGFAPIDGRDGFGIHGTKDESSIPGETSRGCVRMFSQDVIELYDLVPLKAKIEIQA